MAGGNGKGNNVIELRPQHKIAIDEINKALEEINLGGVSTKELVESIKPKVSLEEDPYIKFLALQYHAYMARRISRNYKTNLEFVNLTFADYVDIREGR